MSGRFSRILFVFGLCGALSGAVRAWDSHGHHGQGYASGYGGYGSSYRPVFPTRSFFAEPRRPVERGHAYREGYRDGYGDGYRDRDIQSRHPWLQGHRFNGYYYSGRGTVRGNSYGWNSGSRAREGYRARSGHGWDRH